MRHIAEGAMPPEVVVAWMGVGTLEMYATPDAVQEFSKYGEVFTTDYPNYYVFTVLGPSGPSRSATWYEVLGLLHEYERDYKDRNAPRITAKQYIVSNNVV